MNRAGASTGATSHGLLQFRRASKLDRLSGLTFKKLLERSGISTTVAIQSLKPTQPGWNRKLQISVSPNRARFQEQGLDLHMMMFRFAFRLGSFSTRHLALVTRELGVPVGIENDEITGGKRVLYYQNGQTTMDWKRPRPAFSIPGSWANVDGRLGVVAVAGSGMSYQQATKYARQAVYPDVLCGSVREGRKEFKQGDQVTRRVVVFFLELSPKKTSALAKTVMLDENHKVLRLKLPEGGEAAVPLL